MNFLPKILLLGLISSSGLGIVSPVSAETPAKIEPKALAILKQMSDRLSAARSLAFTATITYENLWCTQRSPMSPWNGPISSG